MDYEPDTDTALWSTANDQYKYRDALHMGVIGITHKYFLDNKACINSSASLSEEYFKDDAGDYDFDLTYYPVARTDNENVKVNIASALNYKFGAGHTNRTGILINYMNYNTDINYAPAMGDDLQCAVDERGSSVMYQFFSQSRIDFGPKLTSNIGFHGQYFSLNREFVPEPRIGLTYNLSDRQSVSFAYGKHSRPEPLFVYFAEVMEDSLPTHPDKSLRITKAHHVVFSWDISFNPQLRLKIEPYYQYLYDVPVIPDSSYSTLNMESDMYTTEKLSNEGTGTNTGIDITLERFLKDGYYYLFTASLFDSKYRGGDQTERNTRFNSNFVFNILVGREWVFGAAKNRILSINGRLNIIGGQWTTPVITDYPYQKGDAALYDNSRPFTCRKPHIYNLNTSVNYRINKRNHAGIWTLQVVNVLGRKEFLGYVYDYKEDRLREDNIMVIVPTLSYKIEF